MSLLLALVLVMSSGGMAIADIAITKDEAVPLSNPITNLDIYEPLSNNISEQLSNLYGEKEYKGHMVYSNAG